MTTIQRMAATPRELLALTLGRLLLIPLVIVSLDAAPAVTFLALLVFVLLDLYDGVVARRLDQDNVTRRVLDSTVDRISIWSVYLAATLVGLLPASLLLLLAVRDIYCGYWCLRLISERNIAIKADWLYRSLNLVLAVWIVLAPLTSAGLRTKLFLALCAYSVLVAMDLRRSIGILLEAGSGLRSQVIPASVLRKTERHPVAVTSPEVPPVHSA